MARIDLPDGRWVDLRPQYLSDKNAIIALNERIEGDNGRYIDLVNGYADILRPAVLATSWGGDIAEMPERRLLVLLADWARLTEEDAVPPASGTSGETSSARPVSRASRSSSRARRSG